MLVDCESCRMREVACMECSVGLLLGLHTQRAAGGDAGAVAGRPTDPPGVPVPHEREAVEASCVVEKWPTRTPFEWDATERRAIAALIDAGLIPPIRAATDSVAATFGEKSMADSRRLAG